MDFCELIYRGKLNCVGAGALGAGTLGVGALGAGALGAGALGAGALGTLGALGTAGTLGAGAGALGTLGAGVGLPIANEIIKQTTGTDMAGGLINAGLDAADDIDNFVNDLIDGVLQQQQQTSTRGLI